MFLITSCYKVKLKFEQGKITLKGFEPYQLDVNNHRSFILLIIAW